MDDIDVFVPKYQISIGSDTMSGAVFYVGFDGGGLPTVQYLQTPQRVMIGDATGARATSKSTSHEFHP